MRIKAFKIALSALLCFSIIPILQIDSAWAAEPIQQQEEALVETPDSSLSDDVDIIDEDAAEETGTDETGQDNEGISEDAPEEEELVQEGFTLEEELDDSITLGTESIAKTSESDAKENKASPAPYSLKYRAHVANVGWQKWVKDGQRAGTEAQKRSMEALQIKLDGTGYSGAIEYRVHVADKGWQGWVSDPTKAGTVGESRQIEAVKIRLTGEIAEHYDVRYRVHSANFGWLGWTNGGKEAGTSGYGYGMEAIEVKLFEKESCPANEKNAFKKRPQTLEAMGHVANSGWLGWKKGGSTIGTTGKRRQMEAFCVKVASPDDSGSVTYRAHIQNVGWKQGWKKDGQIAGSVGKGQRVEAFQIKLTGDLKEKYDIYYCAHSSNIGWMGWTKNGEVAGIPNYCSTVEALKVKLVKKGKPAPDPLPGSIANSTVKLKYNSRAKVKSQKWTNPASGSRVIGTTGKALPLQAFKLSIADTNVSGSIQYRAHVPNTGWQGWQKNGAQAGTGKGRMEAVQIRLTGKLSQYFDVYYRAHVAGWGWNGWAKNGVKAGTAKNALPLEAIQIKIVAKGAPAPGSMNNAYWETIPIPATHRAMNSRVSGLSSPTKWLVAIDSRSCLVGVYYGSRGNWTNKFMWLCSPGAAATPTVKGIYSIGSRGYVFGSGYSCYWWTQFYGDYLFHSVLYYPGTQRIMEGVMGVPASHGCVRLDIGNAKWIHDNIPSGTTVLSY